MASTRVLLYKHKVLKNKKHPILLQLIKDRKKKTISLGYSAYPKEWNEKTNLPNNKHPNSKWLTNFIRKKISEADDIRLELEGTGKPFTLNDWAKKLKNQQEVISVFGFTQELVDRLRKQGKEGNARVYENTLNVFKEFRNNKDLTFEELDYGIIRKYEDYLAEKGNKTNSISVHLRTLRAVYNKAIKEELVNEGYYPFKNYKIKQEETPKRAVTKEDIDKIKALKLDKGSTLDHIRDYFLFSFYMRGMSFVDLAYLKVKNINNGRLEYARSKTKQKFSIKIIDPAMAIINKYNTLEDPDDYVFPIIQRPGKEDLDYRNALRLFNNKLKDLAKQAKISTTLTTYVSRHTWATVAKRMGVSTAVISEGLGHDSEKTTQIYLDSFENDVLDDANELITQ